MKGEIHDIVHL